MELIHGSKAPDFTLNGSDGKQHKLSDYLGKKVIVYFYPKDNTPGCTLEAEAFRDNAKDLEDQNTVILGISKDSLQSHDKFIAKLDLPFILLSDQEEVVCNLYGVLKEKNMYGKKKIGIERSTFIIDEHGYVQKIYRKVKVDGHVEAILDLLKNNYLPL
ncbi:MAG: thioredoxin-dependent thiol peroxidase [Bacillota bacterium]|nr:thioredoxin-dependent thiol peroxidase [Bacillota bacterium]